MKLLPLAGLLACAAPVTSNLVLDVPEFGRVDWQRDHDVAFAAARDAKKPVLLLFQEVPG